LISNYLCCDHFIQGIPDQPAEPAEPQEHGEQQQGESQGESIDEPPTSGGLLTNSVTSSFYSIINIIKKWNAFFAYQDLV